MHPVFDKSSFSFMVNVIAGVNNLLTASSITYSAMPRMIEQNAIHVCTKKAHGQLS